MEYILHILVIVVDVERHEEMIGDRIIFAIPDPVKLDKKIFKFEDVNCLSFDYNHLIQGIIRITRFSKQKIARLILRRE